MDGFGADGGGFGADASDGFGADSMPDDAMPDAAAVGLGTGGGVLMAGGVMGAMSNMVPPTPGAPATPASQRALLEGYRRMVAEGLITEDDYQLVKSKVLGIKEN